MQWQPIETAPMGDPNELFLVWNGEFCTIACHWPKQGWFGCYNGRESDEDDAKVMPSPTHWLEIPAPPGAD